MYLSFTLLFRNSIPIAIATHNDCRFSLEKKINYIRDYVLRQDLQKR